MRGSPLLQCLILLVLLGLVALGFHRITRPAAVAPPAHEHAGHAHAAESSEVLQVSYFIALSAPAKRVVLATTPDATASVPSQGKFAWRPEQPVFLTVEWEQAPAPGERRFAKLTLEPPRLATMTHFFDAAGDIEAVWEP